jgi:tetratricopeptide (TPR) repeat protein
MGTSLAYTGDLVKGVAHYDKAFALYDPAKHRPLTTQFGQDVGVVILSLRAFALWLLGYPDHARADIEGALDSAHEIGHAATLMYALTNAAIVHIQLGSYQEANFFTNEAAILAEQTDAPFWKTVGIGHRGCILSLTGNPSDAVDAITSAVTVWRSTGATLWMTKHLPGSAQFDDAWLCIREAGALIETTQERSWEAEVQRIAGEIALLQPKPDMAKAEAYLNRALNVARAQQGKILGTPRRNEHGAALARSG